MRSLVEQRRDILALLDDSSALSMSELSNFYYYYYYNYCYFYFLPSLVELVIDELFC